MLPGRCDALHRDPVPLHCIIKLPGRAQEAAQSKVIARFGRPAFSVLPSTMAPKKKSEPLSGQRSIANFFAAKPKPSQVGSHESREGCWALVLHSRTCIKSVRDGCEPRCRRLLPSRPCTERRCRLYSHCCCALTRKAAQALSGG